MIFGHLFRNLAEQDLRYTEVICTISSAPDLGMFMGSWLFKFASKLPTT